MKQRSKLVRPSNDQLHFGRVIADEFQRGFGFVLEQGQIRGEIFAHVSILGWSPSLNEWLVYGIGLNPRNAQQYQLSWASRPTEEVDWLRSNLSKFDDLALIALSQLGIVAEYEVVSILLYSLRSGLRIENMKVSG